MPHDLLDFLARYETQHVFAPGSHQATAVDLVNCYLASCFALPPIYLPAVAWQHAPVAKHTWVTKGERNYPKRGALVVFGACPERGIGPAGHISLCVWADRYAFLGADQDWPEGAPVGFCDHDYVGVIGWHSPHPKAKTFPRG